MLIKELFSSKKPVISFEIFPPKTECGLDTIYSTIEELANLKPDFISVTYGAGGVGSDKTVEIASMIKNNFGITALAHLTCINSSQAKIHSIIDALKKQNINNILALRGDIPEGQAHYGNSQYQYASDLVAEIKHYDNVCVGAAAYPEGHIESPSLHNDLVQLEKKVEAGVEFLITQLFFDNSLFYHFIEEKAKYSINVPISVGVMPVLSKQQIQKMIFMCGASLPSKLIRMLYKYENDAESLKLAGIEYAAEQVADLITNGVDGIHIYTMNKPEIAKQILNYIQPRV